MRKHVIAVLVGIVGAAALLASSLAIAGPGGKNVTAFGGLEGYQEVTSISTTGRGTFEARIDDAAQEIHWTLSYEALEGNVLQAHIHFAQPAQNGNISAFLCTNLGNAPAPPATPTAACPPPPATISGVIRPADVIGPADRGIEAGAFDEFVAAIRAGYTYANVHSSKWPPGEIRGQLNDKSQS